MRTVPYDIGRTYGAIDALMENNGKIYRFLTDRRCRGVHLIGRLLNLESNDKPDAYESVSDLAGDLKIKECDDLFRNAESLKTPLSSELSEVQLNALADHAHALYLMDEELERTLDALYDDINKKRPFGLPWKKRFLHEAWERYGDLTHDIQARGEIVLEQITRDGLCVDRDRVRALTSRNRAKRDRLIKSLKKYGYRSDTVDDEEARQVLAEYERQKGVRFKRTGNNDISVSKKNLDPYASRFPFIQAYLDAGKYKRDLMFLKKLDKDRIHPTFDTIIRSGRVSSGGVLPIQGVPATGGIRECFIPSRGHVFVTVDLVGAELGTLAQIMVSLYDRYKLADLINRGEDVHTVVASWIFDKHPADVTKNERNQAKVLNIGIPGGIGPMGLCRNAREEHGISWSEGEAERLITYWRHRFPEVSRYLKEHDEERYGVCTLTGRIRPELTYTQARNTLFQGLAADGMKLALWNLYEAGYKIVNVIHDEVLVEVPICDDYTEAVKHIESLIKAGMKEVTPDIRVSVKSSVSTCWSKKATLVRDDQGRIVPWTDDQSRNDLFETDPAPRKARIIHAKGRPVGLDRFKNWNDLPTQ